MGETYGDTMNQYCRSFHDKILLKTSRWLHVRVHIQLQVVFERYFGAAQVVA